MLVGDITDPTEEVRQLKDRIRLLEVICKGGLFAPAPNLQLSVSNA